MSKFEDRLWSELVLDHGPQLASMRRIEIPHRSRRGPAAIGAVALAGTIAAVALTATTGTSPSVAYAVSQSSDGSVSVSIREISGVDGANAQLARLHVAGQGGESAKPIARRQQDRADTTGDCFRPRCTTKDRV